MKQFAKHVYLDMFYVLDFSGSFYMRIENDKKKSSKVWKTPFFPYGGGGAETVTDWSETFYLRLPY